MYSVMLSLHSSGHEKKRAWLVSRVGDNGGFLSTLLYPWCNFQGKYM